MKSLVVLRNNLERRRRRLLWPGEEENVTPELISATQYQIDIKPNTHRHAVSLEDQPYV